MDQCIQPVCVAPGRHRSYRFPTPADAEKMKVLIRQNKVYIQPDGHIQRKRATFAEFLGFPMLAEFRRQSADVLEAAKIQIRLEDLLELVRHFSS